MSTTALYLNGVYESVLAEISEAQRQHQGKTCYLQPYSTHRITLLADTPPTPRDPVPLYLSVTNALTVVSYRAKIVGWHDKRELAKGELAKMNAHIKALQPNEKEVYMSAGSGQKCVNLISITDLEPLPSPIPVTHFIKSTDGKPLRARSQAGGWAYVRSEPEGLWPEQMPVEEEVERDFQRSVEFSRRLSGEARRGRLEKAAKKPEQIQVLAWAFRRNADVVVEVLARAKGRCERCHSPAPFLRVRDGTPFLEVHHRVTLANGGEDTVENAIALCPNCHRLLHFGPPDTANNP
jgi:5-methylcytosine-specific restriction endonuclease McrA